MARFRRGSRFPARRTRQTAWQAMTTSFNSLSAGQGETVTLCDTSAQHDVGLSPTLLRIRGGILVDPDFDPNATGPAQWHWATFIYVRDSALTSWSAANLAQEDILWAYYGGGAGNRFRTQHTASGVETWGHSSEYVTTPFDVKSKRKLDETDRVFMSVFSIATSDAIDIKYSIWARCLIGLPR